MSYSLTYSATLVAILSTVLEQFGISASTGDLTVTINTIVAIVSGLVAFYGRYRAGGVSALGLRK